MKNKMVVNNNNKTEEKQTERMMIMNNIFNKEILNLINLGDYEEVVSIPIGLDIDYYIVVLKKRNENKLIMTHVIETKSINGWRDKLDLDINPTTLKFYDRFITFTTDIDEIKTVEEIDHLINFNNFLLGSINVAVEYGASDTEEFKRERTYRNEANKKLDELKSTVF